MAINVLYLEWKSPISLKNIYKCIIPTFFEKLMQEYIFWQFFVFLFTVLEWLSQSPTTEKPIDTKAVYLHHRPLGTREHSLPQYMTS